MRTRTRTCGLRHANANRHVVSWFHGLLYLLCAWPLNVRVALVANSAAAVCVQTSLGPSDRVAILLYGIILYFMKFALAVYTAHAFYIHDCVTTHHIHVSNIITRHMTTRLEVGSQCKVKMYGCCCGYHCISCVTRASACIICVSLSTQ